AKDGERLREAMNLKPLKPAVLSFAAQDSEIQPGRSTLLKWETQNATEVSIDGGVGTIPEPSGSRPVSPAATTTYNLVASGPGGKSTPQRVIVKVAVSPQPAGPAPTLAKPAILNFDLGQESIQAGDKVKILWATQNADSVNIDPDVGQVKASGSTTVSPSKT